MSKKKRTSKEKKENKKPNIIVRFFKGIYHIIDRLIVTPISKIMLKVTDLFKTNNQPLDRLLNNKMFLIVFSLVLAFIAFYVTDTKTEKLVNSTADIMHNQNVTALYNEEAYVVEGLPKNVDITLIGRKSDLYLAKQYPSKSAVVDLRNLKPGSHKVSLKYNGMVSSVEYKLDPSTITVMIYEKMSIAKPLSSEILNIDKLDNKYTITDITFDRDEVYIKGAEYKLQQVAVVKALVNIENIVNPTVGTTTLKDIKLVAYDSNGKQIDVEIVPTTVDAKIEIASPSKEVPFRVEPVGEVVFGKSINTITLSSNKVTIYGEEEALAKINSIPVKIDVTGLSSNTEFNVNVSKPSGIRDLSVPAVVAKVTLGETKETTVTGVNIETRNLGNNLIARAASADDSNVDVIVKGTETNIKNVEKDNISAYVDLQGLGEGTHNITVKVTGEDVKLSYTPKTTAVTIVISKK